MILQITVPGTPPIVADVTKEDKDYLHTEYPIVFMKDDPVVYTMPYMPFAMDGNVSFSRNSIIATSKVHLDIENYYKEAVKDFKSQKLSFKKEEEEKVPEIKIPLLKSKTFH